ncbi:peptidoglycan-binding protein [Streptomyces sp. NBC_00669]|uniref:peptidoglycan-binding protein n=1 Tax=Streptomyces sp. NBC_00669 TaxID=2976011 RepID=UPI002E36C725|nr:peptidoglycan-binding protein [Streptomyces sp. NBC_00669]
MSIPVFEDIEPLPSCGCEDCARRRLAASAARDSAAPVGSAARAVVAAAAVGTALGGATVCAAPAATATTRAAAATSTAATASAVAAGPMALTRAQILERAETWVSAKVPYSMTSYWKDGYRQDCSGFVSMAWGLNTNAWTGDLARYAVRITKTQLRPGDVLLFDNAADPVKGSHVVLFGGWVDDARTEYTGYEQTMPGTRVRSIPYAYWSNSAKYVPYRDKYLAAKSEPPGSGAAFPGRGAFGPGANNASVTRLGRMLVGRGARGYYRVGPGPKWGQADARATAAFQRAQGWTGADADGLPGPTTWKYLADHRGKDIGGTPAKKAPTGTTAPTGTQAATTTTAPGTPGSVTVTPGTAGSVTASAGTPGSVTAATTATAPVVAASAVTAGSVTAATTATAPVVATSVGTPGSATTAGATTAGTTAAHAVGGGAPDPGPASLPGPGPVSAPHYPGQGAFRPGRSSADVLALGTRLVAKGFGTHYRVGPSRTWSEADRRNVEAFQRALGWSRRDADGRPGPETWRRLFT